jgi:hypothetical protein
MSDPIPTAREVIAYLNERLSARGLTQHVDMLDVLPYVNPMWLSNWRAPQLEGVAEAEEDVRDARWRFPQIFEEPFTST